MSEDNMVKLRLHINASKKKSNSCYFVKVLMDAVVEKGFIFKTKYKQTVIISNELFWTEEDILNRMENEYDTLKYIKDKFEEKVKSVHGDLGESLNLLHGTMVETSIGDDSTKSLLDNCTKYYD